MIKRVAIALPLAVIGVAWLYYFTLPWPLLVRWHEPGPTAFMEHRAEEAARRGDRLEVRHRWVPLSRISRHLRRAVIVAEDGRFYEHHGVDWLALREELRYRGDADFSWTDAADLRALARSVRYYLSNRDEVRGRSTITQQLAKNLYFSPERSLRRKLGELVVAGRLEWLLGKDRILELYLNTAEWGPGIFGAEAAARHYFEVSASGLSPMQAAALAATLPHPLSSNPAHRPARMAWRQSLILARMDVPGPVETVPLAPPTIEPPDSLDLESPVEPSMPDTPALPLADTASRPDTLPVAPDTLPGVPDTRPVAQPDTAAGPITPAP